MPDARSGFKGFSKISSHDKGGIVKVKFIQATGEIVCAGSFRDDLKAGAGETIVDYTGNTMPQNLNDFWFKDGEFIEKSSDEKYKSNYRNLRSREYPTMGDQLDAIWKGGADLDAMKAQVMAVKAKYPKPV